MSINIFSYIMSILWCNIFTLLTFIFFKKKNFIIHLSIYAVLFLIVLSILRLIFNLELPFVTIFRSDIIFPTIVNFLSSVLFNFTKYSIIIRYADIILYLWVVGSICMLCSILIKEFRFKKIMNKEPFSRNEQIHTIMNQIAKKHHNIKIIETPYISTPMVTGYFRPTIYLPNINFSNNELYFILSHEWSHYIHKDIWIKLFINIICSIYWWNPFFYLLKRDLNNYLEIKSDLHISKNMSDKEKVKYLESILKVAKHVNKNAQSNTTPSSSGLINTKKGFFLKQRFQCILDNSLNKRRYLNTFLFYVFMTLLFLASYCFVIQPYEGPPKEYKSNKIEEISLENSYLKKIDNTTYDWYVNEKFISTINDISEKPFSELPIK